MPEGTAVCPECLKSTVKFYRTVCAGCYDRHWRHGTLDQVPLKPKRVFEPRAEKTCPICQQMLPLESFGKNNRRPDGRGSYCKPCARVKYHVPARERQRSVERPVDGEQACRKCSAMKPYSDYYWESDKGRYRYICKECSSVRDKVYWERAGRISQWERSLRHKFGLTEADYLERLSAQGGACAICRRTPEQVGQKLAVDHCHTSGHVRGLLCGPCNCALGLLGEEPSRFASAVDYLRDTAIP